MPTKHLSRTQFLAIAGVCLAAAVAAVPARAQSLAEVAKKEEERRQKVAEPTKVYTNKDLKAPSGGAAPTTPAPPETPTAAAPKDTGTDATAKTADHETTKDPTKDPAYWSEKQKALLAQLEQDQAFSEAMQTRINSLTADAVNRDDPIQRGKFERDRQKAIADLARLAKAIETDKKAIADFQENARRLGVPPGWLR